MFAVLGSSTAAAALLLTEGDYRRASPIGSNDAVTFPSSSAIGNPEGLIGRQIPFMHRFGDHRFRYELAPIAINDQIQSTQRQYLLLSSQVMNAEETLAPVKALPPKAK